MIQNRVFIGIDAGTQGIRLIVIGETGEYYFNENRRFDLSAGSRITQNPEKWWDSLDELFLNARKSIPADFYATHLVYGIGVTSTSGTILPLGRNQEVLYGAIMYSDPRSADFCEWPSLLADAYYGENSGFRRFSSSSGLPKMLWFKSEFPNWYENGLERFTHASDFITGRLTGLYGVTDHSNALKSGYDIHADCWPEYLHKELGLRPDLLPDVKPMGTVIGKLKSGLAERWGFPEAPDVYVGLTDGCASQFSSGAVSPGTWNTTIGTTMVLKGVTVQEIDDPEGSIYCHRHPEGYWMPGGASNIGADWVHEFTTEEIRDGSIPASDMTPSPIYFYPLKMKGERFPFINPEARGFIIGDQTRRADLFQAGLEGLAFIERYAYERIEGLEGKRIEKVYSSGGGNKNEKWLRIRADVLGKSIVKSSGPGAALGAAMVVASRAFEGGLAEAADKLLGETVVIEPDRDGMRKYEDRYQEFIRMMKRKGIINE